MLGGLRVRVGVSVEVIILIPKEIYNTCNFLGGVGGLDLLNATSLWIHENQ